MSANAVVPPKRDTAVALRNAGPADHATIRDVVAAAYGQYAHELGPEVFTRYLADLLDLDRHTRHGQLLVAEVDGQIRGVCRVLPGQLRPGPRLAARLGRRAGAGGSSVGTRQGVAGALLGASERLARSHGAPVFAFHTGSFMAGAIALYERYGYHRAPEFDLDLSAHYGGVGAAPAVALAYLKHLTQAGHRRLTHCGVSTPHPVGRSSTGRPAADGHMPNCTPMS